MNAIAWVFLSGAILTEVAATLSLRMAVLGRRRWYLCVVVGYAAAFALLSFSLSHGMALGVAYGIWSAAGVALTAVLSRVLFGEPLTRLMVVGLGLVILGVLLVELGANHATGVAAASLFHHDVH